MYEADIEFELLPGENSEFKNTALTVKKAVLERIKEKSYNDKEQKKTKKKEERKGKFTVIVRITNDIPEPVFLCVDNLDPNQTEQFVDKTLKLQLEPKEHIFYFISNENKVTIRKREVIEGEPLEFELDFSQSQDIKRVLANLQKSKVLEKTVKKPKKKKKFPTLLVVGGIVVAGIVVYLLLGKKKETKKYTLNVTVGEGVQGTPGSGTIQYEEGTTVSYNYSLQSGFKDLVVSLDGTETSPSGTVTMNQNHTLTATAAPLSRYTLSVTKGEGVEGTPDSGVYTQDEGTSLPYSYSLEDGYTNLEVKLDDVVGPTSGNITMDANHTLVATAVKIESVDNPPTVRIVAPGNRDTVSGTVAVKAEASDDKGITKVEFYIDDILKEADKDAPYKYEWNTGRHKQGEHKIKVIAYDTANPVQTAEHRISVIVNNTPKNKLKVSLGEDVKGEPGEGTHFFPEGTPVNYSYNVEAGHKDLIVKLDVL